jgi:outer membrane beta-barrel protein
MRAPLKLLAPLAALVGLAGTSLDAHAGAKPARKALKELNEGDQKYNVVQNRFFLKKDRFELSPMAGYVPNNPFAKRYVGGVLGAWHFSETLAAEGAFMYSPDLGVNDLKDLTHTLVGIAREGSGDVEFQQPVDKMVLGATIAARWAPVYGKINLLGERVLNFDFYGTAGLGLLTIDKYYAVYDEDAADGVVPTKLEVVEVKPVLPLNLGVGMDFFLSSSVALKIDARNYLYIDSKPDYDPDPGNQVTENRLYNNFVASAGISIFFPKMKPRYFDF